jgi:hypothetical protein
MMAYVWGLDVKPASDGRRCRVYKCTEIAYVMMGEPVPCPLRFSESRYTHKHQALPMVIRSGVAVFSNSPGVRL